MRGDLGRLLVRYLLLALGVVLLNFLIPRLLPGDPLSFNAGGGLNAAVPLPEATRSQLAAYYRLDESLGRQFLSYLDGLAHGDLGWSIARPGPVSQVLLDRLPWTLGLLLFSLLVALMVGTALGVVAGWSPLRARSRLLVSFTAALAAVPEFVVAIGLLAAFGAGLRWFPLFGGRSPFASQDGTLGSALDIARHLTLPAAALVVVYVSGFCLLSRDVTAGVHQAEWLAVARSKGLSERQVAWRHALPNITPPLLTFFALRLGGIFGGALVVERVFNVPGLGLLAFQSIGARDYPVLQALFLLSALGVLAANLAVEVVYLRHAARGSAIGG